MAPRASSSSSSLLLQKPSPVQNRFVCASSIPVPDHRRRCWVLAMNDNIDIEDENDGWDTDENRPQQPISRETLHETENTSTRKSISDERSLNIKSSRKVVVERDDDLFIPIFALVSIGGLLGAYGYEMIRLYSRGELYLPFLHEI